MASVVLAPAAHGQEPAPALRADYQFPATARPIAVEQPPSAPLPTNAEQRLPFRLVTAEAPQPAADARPPLKLAPRNATGKEPIAKPIAPNPANAIGTVVASLGIVLGLFLILV